MPLNIVRNDITMMETDAIVNAANIELQMGGGACGAIFSEAGANDLQEACDKIGRCGVGEAVITKGYNLPAKYIIHTVGPIWKDGKSNEDILLHNAYTNSLNLALKHNLKSIAFPLIASGIYGYPKDKAIQIAVSAIGEFLLVNEMDVYLVIYDKKAMLLSEKLFSKIEKFIDDNYVDKRILRGSTRVIQPYEVQESFNIDDYSRLDFPIKKRRSLTDVVDQLEESFSEMLLRLIDEKGMTDVDTYKRANIDRRLFSKIRSDVDYNPSKVTAIAFAIALNLNFDETCDLLGKAGYALSRSSKFDVIIEYFIEEENYNIYEINEALFSFGQVLLGV